MEKNPSLAPLHQELTRQKIGEVEKFYLAKTKNKISEASEEEIKQALMYAMFKIGLRSSNFPEGVEKMLLIQHVMDSFPDNTVDEIKICFDWAISGRIEEDFNCYENFSCAYFSKMMKAYNRLAGSVKPALQSLPAPIKEESRKPLQDYDKFIETDFAKTLISKGIEIPKW